MILEGSVTQIKTSPDSKYLISCGEDGCIFVFALTQIDSHNHIVETKVTDEYALNRELIIDDELGDILLMPKSGIDNCVSEVK